MNPVFLTLAPALLAPGVGAKRVREVGPWLLLGVAAAQAALAIVVAFTAGGTDRIAGGYLTTDPTARLFLVLIDVIYLGICGYVWNRDRAAPSLHDAVSRYARFSLVFMAAANVVVLSNHLLLSWVALETTTLAAAPLILVDDLAASRRASFRYFLF